MDVKTRLSILSTVGSLHTEPLRYDLECVRSIVLEVAPDLLCAEITRKAWESKDLSTASLEVREALAPIVRLTETVLIPVLPSQHGFESFTAPPGLQQGLARAYDRLLRWGQRAANGPEGIHGPVFEALCHIVCTLTEMTWSTEDRSTWEAQNQAMAKETLSAIRRDPGRRVLVVAQCQRIHKLEPLLKPHLDVLELVDYREL